ncbi:hypothetical protein Tco_1503585 [Tanacetum coccineum]
MNTDGIDHTLMEILRASRPLTQCHTQPGCSLTLKSYFFQTVNNDVELSETSSRSNNRFEDFTFAFGHCIVKYRSTTKAILYQAAPREYRSKRRFSNKLLIGVIRRSFSEMFMKAACVWLAISVLAITPEDDASEL